MNDVATSVEFRGVSRNIAKNTQLADELFQEMLIVLWQQKEERLIEMYRRKQIKWFVIGLLSRMWNRTKGDFYKTHRRFMMQCSGISVGGEDDISGLVTYGMLAEYAEMHSPTTEQDILRKQEVERLHDIINEDVNSGKYWYEAMLMRHTLRLGSMRKVANATRIPYKSIQGSIRNYKKRIKKRLDEGR